MLGAQALTRSDMDALVSQIPLDPFITLGLITFTCGGVGWLAGPIVGTGLFNYRNRNFRVQMDEKEKEFYRRVKKYRVDPSASSMANPVPGIYPIHCACYGANVTQTTTARRFLASKDIVDG